MPTLEEVNEFWIKSGVVKELPPLTMSDQINRPFPRIYLPILGDNLKKKFKIISTSYVYVSRYRDKYRKAESILKFRIGIYPITICHMSEVDKDNNISDADHMVDAGSLSWFLPDGVLTNVPVDIGVALARSMIDFYEFYQDWQRNNLPEIVQAKRRLIIVNQKIHSDISDLCVLASKYAQEKISHKNKEL